MQQEPKTKRNAHLTAQNYEKIRAAKEVFPGYDESYLASLLYPKKVDRFEYHIRKIMMSESLDQLVKAREAFDHVFQRHDTKCLSATRLKEVLGKIIRITSDFSQLVELVTYCNQRHLPNLAEEAVKKMQDHLDTVFAISDISTFYATFHARGLDKKPKGSWFHNGNPKHYSKVVKIRTHEIFNLKPEKSYTVSEVRQYFLLTMEDWHLDTVSEYDIYQIKSYAERLHKTSLGQLGLAKSVQDCLNLLTWVTYSNIRDGAYNLPGKIVDKVIALKPGKDELLRFLAAYRKRIKGHHGWDEDKEKMLVVEILRHI
ncbi:hypothetical protein H7X65_03875 [Candidatus Parcubacteria bacterium]|nr:hypothetical protein [Candidatus Parcubacteria bacterium]